MSNVLSAIFRTVFRVVKGHPIEDSAVYSPQKIEILARTIGQNALIGTTIVALFTVFWKRKRSRIREVALLLTIADLFFFSRGNVITMPLSLTRQKSAVQAWLSQNLGNDRYLSASGNLPYTGLGVYWTHLRAREPFSPNGLTDRELTDFSRLRQELLALPENQGMQNRLFDASGYAAAVPEAYLRFWQENPASPNAATINDLGDHKLNVVGTKYVVTGYPEDYISDPQSNKFVLAYETDEMKIYRNLDAWPRAFLNDEDRTPAHINEYSPTRVRLRAEADKDTDLVLTDTEYPGWIARVDGESTPISRYKSTFRMVSVPQGIHEIEFLYQPKSVKAGAIISLVSISGITVFGLWKRRRP